MKTVEAARGYWTEILSQYIDKKHLVNRHTACPICGGKDRFRYDNKGGNGTAYCNQCGAKNGMSLLMQVTGWDFKTAAREIDKMIGNSELKQEIVKPQNKDRIINFIHSKLTVLETGDNVYKYLKNRGINSFDSRYFRKLVDFDYMEDGFKKDNADCMVAVITDVNNQRLGYHITYIKDGKKAAFVAPKKILGNCKGGSIKIGKPKNRILAVTEGIENALSVTQQYNKTCWAAISANGLKEFQPPKDIDYLLIVADNDFSFTGQEAAYSLAKRVTQMGIECFVDLPKTRGYDFNQEMVINGI